MKKSMDEVMKKVDAQIGGAVRQLGGEKPLGKDEKDAEMFLRESNAIEGVYDKDSFKQALYAWHYLLTREELTVGDVLKTHKILMLHQKLQPDEIGYFRTCEVRIGWRFGLNYSRVPEAMSEWIEDVKTSMKIPGKDGTHFKIDHITYEKIHPFVDGNGRTGRIFLNWCRVKSGLPVLIIHTGKEQMEYYKWFK